MPGGSNSIRFRTGKKRAIQRTSHVVCNRRRRMINEAPRYCNMRLVTHEDFLKFCKDHEYVIIDDQRVPIGNKWSITSYGPESYSPEKETVWSFPRRGDWATHIGNYRGNWSPFIPRNLIERFTNRGDLVLDQMVGSGTTLVECKLLGRNGIGVDINPDAIMVTRDRLNFSYHPIREGYVEPRILTFVGDARNLDELEDESVDLIATHPPYASIIRFSGRRVQGDLSSLIELEDYLAEIRIVADESMRVLKPGKHCAVLIGDTRKHKHYVPIAMRVMQEFLNAGFVLRENVVKIQWNAKATREKWKGQELDFYRIAHEHLFIFRKVPIAKEIRKLRLSSRWW